MLIKIESFDEMELTLFDTLKANNVAFSDAIKVFGMRIDNRLENRMNPTFRLTFSSFSWVICAIEISRKH